ncbi:hypothetical protein Lgee_1299 [Legionella geestiana]|uniref:Uncharacterized protein n=1 Tax=Legionella geestiana TaxID=45065 RepID=A0A0W0TTU9_9GAMM|nr:hypothetical protein [Legionella geestiana]KTC99033.1 hypothetical protein Lgee_1299 [Legionella geestiana]QBS12635.1 hypothetical protein E4T54_07705 [Legionella geestiana]STX54905.1 Uncharacterised protein [Legionella geestiana]
MQLTANSLLLKALTDFNVREKLVAELSLTSEDLGDACFYKWIMAFWLGSSVSRSLLLQAFRSEVLPVIPYLDLGYYCLLTIERHRSLLDSKSSASHVLYLVAARFLLYYNTHFSSLREAPKVFFYPLILAFDELSITSDSLPFEREMYKSAKTHCLGFLAQMMRATDRTELLPLPPQPFFVNFGKPVSYWARLRQQIVRAVASGPLSTLPFSEGSEEMSSLLVYKFLLPAHDGVVLEGVHMRQRETHRDVTVLVLIGKVQTEHLQLSRVRYGLPEFFKAEVVFINHRNFSLHSSKRAESLNDIALDIVTFAKHTLSRGKSVVLYGMCAGAAPMILAAERLMQQKIPFKLIVDRFADRYTSFFDYKTIKRHGHLMEGYTNGLIRPFYLHALFPLSVITFLAYWFVLLAFFIGRVPSRFDTIINQIPVTDLLIFQARGPKTHRLVCFDKPETGADTPKMLSVVTPNVVDALIYPEHDLRHSAKARREANKFLLKSLKRYALTLSAFFEPHQITHAVFQRFAIFFDACLQCISNEKLTTPVVDDCRMQPYDIHTVGLPLLATRHNVPLSRFIHGFYSRPAHASVQTIKGLDAALQERVKAAFLASLPEKAPEVIHRFSAVFYVFFNTLENHADYIGNMADRLTFTGEQNIAVIIEELHAISQQPCHSEHNIACETHTP